MADSTAALKVVVHADHAVVELETTRQGNPTCASLHATAMLDGRLLDRTTPAPRSLPTCPSEAWVVRWSGAEDAPDLDTELVITDGDSAIRARLRDAFGPFGIGPEEGASAAPLRPRQVVRLHVLPSASVLRGPVAVTVTDATGLAHAASAWATRTGVAFELPAGVAPGTATVTLTYPDRSVDRLEYTRRLTDCEGVRQCLVTWGISGDFELADPRTLTTSIGVEEAP